MGLDIDPVQIHGGLQGSLKEKIMKVKHRANRASMPYRLKKLMV